jgi:hypothetical protein
MSTSIRTEDSTAENTKYLKSCVHAVNHFVHDEAFWVVSGKLLLAFVSATILRAAYGGIH